MKKKGMIILSVALFAAFLAVCVFAYNKLSGTLKPDASIQIAENSGSVDSKSGNDGQGADASEKTKAPDFTVTDMDGAQVKLSEMYGKPVVVNFWASWCPPCKAEMPDFDRVYLEKGNDVTFMMVDLVGMRETKESGEKYIEEQGFSFPVYFDTKQEAAAAYGISSIPTTLFIDKDGYIVTGARGAIDERTLRYGIDLISGTDDTSESESGNAGVSAEYRKISPQEAKEQMDSGDGYILLDVRTQPEFDEEHIGGAMLIPDTELSARAEQELTDKDATILVYCRSGRRSELAAKELVNLGYSNVYDFGGIIDWPYDVE